jgi:competence protein ComEC
MPPALWPAVAVLAGAVVGASTDLTFRSVLPALPILWVAAVAAVQRGTHSFGLALIVGGYGLCGLLLAADARAAAIDTPLRRILGEDIGQFLIDDPGPEGDHEPMAVRALLLEDAAVREDYVSLRVRVATIGTDRRPAEGAVILTVSGDAAARQAGEWRAGRVIDTFATFRRPARYLNDGVVDFERQLAINGTTLLGSVKSGLLIDVVANGSTVEEWSARVRGHVRHAVSRWVAPHGVTGAAIVTAVLIGDRTGLSDSVTDRLQRAGTYHVIAISGGNIAILAGLVLGTLTLCGVHGRARALITIAALVAYAGIATSGPSVWRATAMAIVYLAARLLDHRAPPRQAIALTAAVMAGVAPLDVMNPGFVLTFGATCALLESARWCGRPASAAGATSANRLRQWAAASIVASVAVELVLIPVSAGSFSRVTLAGPILNLAAVPLMAVAQVSGLLVVALDRWAALAGPAGVLASLSASAIVDSARLVDVLPALSWRVPPPGAALVIVYYLALLTLLFAMRRRVRLTAAAVFAAALVTIVGLHPRREVSVPDGVRLTTLDVGQGESMLLESGDVSLQIDAGGAPFGGGVDIGARVIAPSLWARRVTRLDALLVTHGDPDHIGGAPVLLEAFTPRQLWEGVVVPRHEPSRQVRQTAATVGGASVLRRAGESLQWGRATLRVLHPPEPDWERPRVRNDDSVVLEVTCGDVALLLTGDIGGDVERAIAPQLTPARVRILKVAHHGSRTSSSAELLESWRPQIAIISAGRGNTFGHPAPEVIGRLESIGARIYRTDRDGQITMETNCRGVTVRTFSDEKDQPRRSRGARSDD